MSIASEDSYDERLREINSKGTIKLLFPDLNPEYRQRKALGFYNNFSDIHDQSGESWLARKTACTASEYMVALSRKSSNGFEIPLFSSGVVVEFDGIKKILTSTYIFGGSSEIIGLKADVSLPSGKEVSGSVSYVDIYNNIVLIDAELDDTTSATLSTDFVNVGDNVLSLGLHSDYGLMACRGTIIVRKDDLDSDDLMSSSCIISESGIGGPVVVQQTGILIGINIYINKKSSLFMPSCILAHSLEYLLTHGRVLRPYLGLKARSLNEKNLPDLVSLYKKLSSFKGIFVTEVTEGSPAHRAGICVDDIILSCNDKNLSSPIQLSDLCLKFGKGSPSRERKRKRKHFFLKVVIQRPTTFQSFEKIIKFKDFNHPGINRWPVIPLDVSVDNCLYNFLSFQGGTIPSFTVSTRDLAEILPNDNQELGKADAKFSGFNVGIGVKPPEEDTLINAVDPINAENSSWAPYSGSCNVDLWSLPSSTLVNVRGKSAALDVAVKVERPMVGGHDPLLLHSPYNMRKPEISYPNQQINSSSPHLQVPSINYSKTRLHSSDSHSHLDPHMKITPQDSIIHRDAPKNHQFSTNMDRPLRRY